MPVENCGGCENCDGEGLCEVVTGVVVTYTTEREDAFPMWPRWVARVVRCYKTGLKPSHCEGLAGIGETEGDAVSRLVEELRASNLRGVLRKVRLAGPKGEW